ncbi:kelch-like protein 31 [Arctopsyche grandis]|uniref:kelch-like protein 31 n=1 Tax=Arctopsyche grandis TaxID=121162 RepID=UPI00406D6B2F
MGVSYYLDVLLNSNNFDTHIVDNVFDYVRKNFMDFYKEDRFYQLDFHSFVAIISSDDLNVYSEEIVFESAKNWLDINDKTQTASMFQFVRLPLLSAKYLMSQVEPYAYSIPEARPLVIDSISYHLFPNDREKYSSARTRQRKSFRRLLGFYGKNAELYDASKNSWTQLKPLNINKRNYGVAIFENTLMIIGGYMDSPAGSLNTVESIDINTGVVSSMASLQHRRQNIGVIVIGEGKSTSVYVVGGWGDVACLKTVERYDSVSMTWSYVAPMNTGRDACGVASIDDKIYAAGGRDGTIYLKSLEVYDVKKNQWETKAPMNQTRGYCMMASAGDYVYAISGYSGVYGINPLTSVERYDARNNSWLTVASVSGGGYAGCSALGIKPVFIGGSGPSNIVQEYDPDTNVWRKLAPLNTGNELMFAVQIPWCLDKSKFNW